MGSCDAYDKHLDVSCNGLLHLDTAFMHCCLVEHAYMNGQAIFQIAQDDVDAESIMWGEAKTHRTVMLSKIAM